MTPKKEETGGKASMMDLIEKKLDKKKDQTEQVISSQVVSQENNLDLTNDTSSQVINTSLVHESVRIAYKERPRVSFWSPRVSAIMYYLKKTVPDYSKSEEAETLIEEGLSKKYPDIFRLVTEEMEKDKGA
jgi:hypothetical protein